MDDNGSPPARKRNARAGKPPARQHYCADFLADERVALMTTTQIGAYALLLDYHWREGSIPADPKKIAKLSRLSGSRFDQIWNGCVQPLRECFQDHPEPEKHDRLIQSRSWADKVRYTEQVQACKDSGSLGGRKSAKLRAARQGTLEPPSSQPQPLRSASALASATDRERSTEGSKAESAVAPSAPLIPLALREIAREPHPVSADEQRRLGDLIAQIERSGGLADFRPGQWWGKGRKLLRRPGPMLATLERLATLLRDRKPPHDGPWAYCEGTYEEIAADDAAAKAEAENERRKREPTIFDQ
jgi:uncharacterized protein YdaU (DUF1376 family)